ncbi:hypothetical protein VTJ49DRAFT_3410 [Mycothermus thermophilus]|uniref:BTB domain-containing protein n=1 Tax=Humicola insolens TaxID=85995 RepID=A0ABR3V7K3_HUMIN
MDFVEVVVVASPFANITPLYDVDPDADALLIVPPPKHEPKSSHDHQPLLNGINGTHAVTEVNGVDGLGIHNPSDAYQVASPPATRSQKGLRLKVSSKHLTLASRVFKIKLQFANLGAARQSDGRVHLQLAPVFDPTAVSIVMNALHVRGSKVPKTLDLETLTNVAVFVDRFQLVDAIDIYAERWISRLEASVPTAYTPDLIRWIYISHVFRHADIFKAVTKAAAAQSSGPIPTLGLPIRDKIINHIDTARQSLLTQAFARIHTAVDDLTSGVPACPSQHCDSLLLGELTRSLQPRGLLWPRPAKPYAGVSFAAVTRGVDAGIRLIVRRRDEAEDRARRRREAEQPPWFMRKKSSGSVSPGAVRVQGPPGVPTWPLTPAPSPDPSVKDGWGGLDFVHECDATRVVDALQRLRGLVGDVEGLTLESPLGYQAY